MTGLLPNRRNAWPYAFLALATKSLPLYRGQTVGYLARRSFVINHYITDYCLKDTSYIVDASPLGISVYFQGLQPAGLSPWNLILSAL